MTAILFRNATIVDATRTEARAGFDVLVEGDRIKEVSDKPITASGAREIDLKGATLMPGLVDAHVHVKATDLDLSRLGIKYSSYIYAETTKIMEGMLQRGFTTVRDAAGADKGLADAVDHGLIAGPRLRVCGLALSQTGGHSDQRPVTAASDVSSNERYNVTQHFGRIADGVDECRRAARDELRKGAHHVKIMAGGGVSSPTDPIENTQYSMDELIAINQEAEAWNTYTMAHTYTPRAIQMCVEAGTRTLEHCNLIDEETAKMMAEHDAYHVPTNITYWALNKHGKEYGFPDVSIEKLQVIVDAGLGAVEISKNAGVKIGFGTDLLGPCHHYQANEFGLAAQVLGNHGALKASLETNAEIMYLQDEIGKVQAGFKADLIVVQGNPLDDISCLENDGAKIPFVMRDGIVFKDRLDA